MGAIRTVGHEPAVAAVRAMLGSAAAPHAVLLVGPASVGKTTLAIDLAAGLLCTGAAGAERPCGACRSCRMVEHGAHPDLHRLGPEGPGGQIGIGGQRDRPPGVRELVTALALLPLEGVARVAIVERAQRMNEDAQSALLKTLEEPPPATTIVLCADDEERLLPTVRSRCARIRFGPLATRDIERLLAELDAADAPTAARLAHIAGGRPGLALAYARSSEAVAIRAELSRRLLDLLAASSSERLAAARDLLARAGELVAALGGAAGPEPPGAAASARQRAGRARGARPAEAGAGDAPPESGASDGTDGESSGVRIPAAERRRALSLLLELWRELARDLVVVRHGSAGSVSDPALLDELATASRSIADGDAAAALERLARAHELIDANVTPELLLDVLVLRWPGAARAA